MVGSRVVQLRENPITSTSRYVQLRRPDQTGPEGAEVRVGPRPGVVVTFTPRKAPGFLGQDSPRRDGLCKRPKFSILASAEGRGIRVRAGRQWEVRSQEGAHPRAAVAPQSGSCAVVAIEEFHVVIATVGLLFHLEGLEHQLHTVAFLGHDDPLAVHPSGVVVIAKLGVGIKVFGLHICPHLAPTLCRGGMTRLTVTDEKTIFTEPPRTTETNSGTDAMWPVRGGIWLSLKQMPCYATSGQRPKEEVRRHSRVRPRGRGCIEQWCWERLALPEKELFLCPS